MKKIFMVTVIGLCLATAGAFAEHPKSSFGIGVLGQYGWGWNGGAGYGGAALSLHLPNGLFWGVNLGLGDGWFNVGVTGDKYLIDKTLVKAIGLGWYFGLGGYAGFYSWKDAYAAIDFGIRAPIGLSWQPIKLFELFLDVAPSIGLGIRFGDNHGDTLYLGGSIPVELGLRFWF